MARAPRTRTTTPPADDPPPEGVGAGALDGEGADIAHLHPSAAPLPDADPEPDPAEAPLPGTERGNLAGDVKPSTYRGRPVVKTYLVVTARWPITPAEAETLLAGADDLSTVTVEGRAVRDVFKRVKVKPTAENADGIAYHHQVTFHGAEGTADDDD